MRKLLLLLVSCSLLTFADDTKLASDLKGKTGDVAVDVVVQYAVPPTQRHKDRIAAHGGQVKTDLQVVKAVSASLPASKLRDLSNDPDVVYVSPDRTVAGSLNYVTTAVGANYAWQSGYDGTGIGVAVIDSGINPGGSDFNTTPTSKTSRVVYSQNFTT
ncbi:MAG: protease inhibitor I9 family protein, partial [Terriglobales bacterium]